MGGIAALRVIAARAAEFPAMADRAAHRAMVGPATVVAGGVDLAAAGTIQRQVGAAGDVTPVAVVEDTRPAAEAEGILVVVAAAIPVAEDMAEVITKKLGDVTSLREAAT